MSAGHQDGATSCSIAAAWQQRRTLMSIARREAMVMWCCECAVPGCPEVQGLRGPEKALVIKVTSKTRASEECSCENVFT